MSDREQARRDELQMIAAREVMSLACCAVLLAMMHPAVHRWVEHQAWRWRQRTRRAALAEDAAVAELRRDISRYEHGEVTW